MFIKKVSVVTPNGERTIRTSKPKGVRAVITVRQQVQHAAAWQRCRGILFATTCI